MTEYDLGGEELKALHAGSNFVKRGAEKSMPYAHQAFIYNHLLVSHGGNVSLIGNLGEESKWTALTITHVIHVYFTTSSCLDRARLEPTQMTPPGNGRLLSIDQFVSR